MQPAATPPGKATVGAHPGSFHFLTIRNLSALKECFDQLPFPASDHPRKSLEPFAFGHLGIGMQPIGQHLKLDSRNASRVNAVEQVIKKAWRQILAAIRGMLFAVKSAMNLFSQSLLFGWVVRIGHPLGKCAQLFAGKLVLASQIHSESDHLRLLLARQVLDFFDHFGCRHADIVLKLRGLFNLQPRSPAPLKTYS